MKIIRRQSSSEVKQKKCDYFAHTVSNCIFKAREEAPWSWLNGWSPRKEISSEKEKQSLTLPDYTLINGSVVEAYVPWHKEDRCRWKDGVFKNCILRFLSNRIWSYAILNGLLQGSVRVVFNWLSSSQNQSNPGHNKWENVYVQASIFLWRSIK